MNLPPTPWRAAGRLAAAVAVAALATVPGVAPAAGEGSATLTQDGWWNRAQGPVSAGPAQEPANPLRNSLNPQVPKPPSVPDNALAVSSSGTEPTAVAAVGFILDAPPGATVTDLTLSLKEAPGRGANQNAANAVIVACPITSFWAGAKNASWVDRPAAECADPGAAKGERAPDGTWTFKLTTLGQSIVDGQLEPNGVLLAPGADARQPFQVSLLDIESDAASISFEATGGGFDTAFDPGADTGPTDFESPLGGDFAFDPAPAPSFTPAPSLDAPPPMALGDAAPAEPPSERRVVRDVARREPAGLTDIPGGALLLIPLGLLGAGGLAYALGPAGRPDTATVRRGGVSRALGRRATTSTL